MNPTVRKQHQLCVNRFMVAGPHDVEHAVVPAGNVAHPTGRQRMDHYYCQRNPS